MKLAKCRYPVLPLPPSRRAKDPKKGNWGKKEKTL